MPNETQELEGVRLLREAIAKGLTFGEAMHVFAEKNSERDLRIIEAARDSARDGEVEIDDATICSGTDGNGDYVLAWVWAEDPKANQEEFLVLSPDGFPTQPDPFPTLEAAQASIPAWIERYRAQGYYLTADRKRIPVDELHLHLEIETVPAGEEEEEEQ